MILPLLAAVSMAAATAPSAAPKPAVKPVATTPIVNGVPLPAPVISPKVENSCSVVTPAADPKAPPTYTVAPGFRVLGGPARLTMPKSDKAIGAIACRRDTVVPGEGDGRVILTLGKVLILSDGAREGVLQMQKGKYSFSMMKGELTPTEKTAIGQRLNIMQANFQAVLNAQAAAAKTTPAAAPLKK
jgi:hypothetical protein